VLQGVLLLQVGLWATLHSIEPRLKKSRITHDAVHRYLHQSCRGHLTHAMGTQYAAIVMRCLDDWSGDAGKTHMDFERQVVTVLEDLSIAL
jgi:uncharacterized protein HemY